MGVAFGERFVSLENLGDEFTVMDFFILHATFKILNWRLVIMLCLLLLMNRLYVLTTYREVGEGHTKC